MMVVKTFIKKLLPEGLLRAVRPLYHGSAALIANAYFGRPSEGMIVIGVTGTNGKTTTVNLIARILEEAGYKVGFMSTANQKIGSDEHLNPVKMTTMSGWFIQKSLAKMVKDGTQYAILEMSSEGLAQNRHLGINFDIAVFTNLTPEHLESHGGFENYKHAKGKLFAAISKYPVTKAKLNINSGIKKTIITNTDSEHSVYYAGFPSDQHRTYGIKQSADVMGDNITYSPNGIDFKVGVSEFKLHLKGQFDVYNSLAAVAVAETQGVSLEVAKTALEKISVIPGRVEVIPAGKFNVVVDYAYEPEEMRQLYETIARWPHALVIQVLGPTGGGRDQDRIPLLGKMAGKFAAKVFITTDDQYDEDPRGLAKRMLKGSIDAGKQLDRDVYIELDRRTAIHRALQTAQPNDIVLITGKGAEQKLALANDQYIDWDDRKVVREELAKMNK